MIGSSVAPASDCGPERVAEAECQAEEAMGSIQPLDLLLRLGVAALLGAMLGIERELRGKPMGMRTLTLISVGSTVFTLIAVELLASDGDPSNTGRILQGVISGIGVVGVAVILHQGPVLRLATTGACVWMIGGVGIACGLGLYLLATSATILTIVVLWLFGVFERQVLDRRPDAPPSVDQRQNRDRKS